MEKIIDKFMYKKMRKKYLNKCICNIGDIVEEEDKIICYVKQELLDKQIKKNLTLGLRLNGINNANEDLKKIADYFDLNKPVYYVFENINFNVYGLKFSSLFAHVIFRNCNFENFIKIIFANDVTFENNKYYQPYSTHGMDNCFFDIYSIEKLTLINEEFVNSAKVIDLTEYNISLPKFSIKIKGNEIEIINTNVNANYQVDIECNKINIDNSHIYATDFYLDTKYMNFYNSSINAEEGIMIDNPDCKFLENINSPLENISASILVYNGVDFGSNCNVQNNNSSLEQARGNLVEKLRNIRDYCNLVNENQKQIIENQTIYKIYKK